MSSAPFIRRTVGQTITAALIVLIAGALTGGCERDASRPDRSAKNTLSLDVDTVLTDTSFALVNQDSSAVTVPDDFLGAPVLLGTIYTNCPNVCPQITANMKSIRDQMPDTTAVQFVSVTFDPHRDTPSRLAAYRKQFGLEKTSWHFLTGDRETIGRLMDRLDVRHTIQGTDRAFPRADTADGYVYNHSNQITLIDGQGRVRAEYAGSQTPPSLIIEDLQRVGE
jgi:protein SCO1/2